MADTTISLKRDTKEALRRLGEKGETYDDIVRRLIEVEVSPELDAEWNRIAATDEFFPIEDL